MKLRDYQQEAVTSVAKSLIHTNRTLLVAPTASGKSIMIASMVERILKAFPQARILILCHQGHLLAQNEEKINLIAPEADTGLYCAGQGRKEADAQVVLASRDSLGRNPKVCGEFQYVICDEAHMIPLRIHQDKGPDKDTHYGKIFRALDAKYVIGLTGTPWRNKNNVVFGKGRFFEKLAYNIPMTKLIDDGFLCPYLFPKDQTKHIDVDHLEVGSTGDYKVSELEEVTNSDSLVNLCLDTWQRTASDRVCSIFFCVSVKHAELVLKELGNRIGAEKVAYVDGATTKKQRDILFQDIKDGKYKAVVNIGVLTTGFDAPVIDCVVWLRPTQSASLFIQMGGRGLRIYPGKEDCLMLDMAGNFQRFDSLEMPFAAAKNTREYEEKEAGAGVAPTKECPECMTVVPASSKVCDFCGSLFTGELSPEAFSSQNKLRVHSIILDDNRVTAKGRACAIVNYTLWDKNGYPKFEKQTLVLDNQFPSQIHRPIYLNIKKNKFPDYIRLVKKGSFTEIKVVEWRDYNFL